MLRGPGRHGHGDRRARRLHAAADTLAMEPDGIFLSNGPGDPAALPAQAGDHRRAAGPGAGVRHLPRPSAPGVGHRGPTYKLPFGHHGGNHPVRRLDTGQVEITSQNHNYAVDGATLPDSGPFAAEVTHVNLNDGVVEGFRCTERGRLQRAVPPRGRARSARRPLPLRTVPAHDRRGARLMPRRTDIETILVIGSGPIVIGQACEFDYSGNPGLSGVACRGLPGRPRQLQPGHDHDRPCGGGPDLCRAARPRRAARRRRTRAARRPAAHHGRTDGPQPGLRPLRARRPRRVRRGADRRQRQGHRHRRGPRPVQDGHGGDRPRGAVVGLRHPSRRGHGAGRAHRLPAHDPAQLHPGRRGHGDGRHPRPSWPRWRPRASRPARSIRS